MAKMLQVAWQVLGVWRVVVIGGGIRGATSRLGDQGGEPSGCKSWALRIPDLARLPSNGRILGGGTGQGSSGGAGRERDASTPLTGSDGQE